MRHKLGALLFLLGLQLVAGRLVRREEPEEKAAHFGPRMQHQPVGATVGLDGGHAVECPVEANPDAEIKWFKDDQLLASQPGHLDQVAHELTFLHMSADDTGEYHCQATNYLGTVTSDRFQLTVQSSVHEPLIQLEPSSAQVEAEQPVEFVCKIPAASQRPDVEWRRNGRRLAAKWIAQADWPAALASERQIGRFLARQLAANEFALAIIRSHQRDDNSTFTCLYKPLEEADSGGLLRESAPARLRVLEPRNQVRLEVNLAPPIENLEAHGQQTTQLREPQPPRRQASLRETLSDLYQLSQPTLLATILLLLVGLMLLLQFLYIRRRTRQNRYMKHQFCSTQASSASSATVLPDCAADPVLSSLMGRTLSAAPSAISLGAGASKKYRSCRDHLRKVAAASEQLSNADLVDGYIAQQHQRLLQQHQRHQLDQELLLGAAQLPPSLFNQSLAAREQARNLLQASEHMRSLSNLTHLQQASKRANQTKPAAQNGSQLNLHSGLSALGGPLVDGSGQLQAASNALWSQYLVSSQQQRHHQQQQQPNSKGKADENYQLVNCASSSSPSSSDSSSSMAAEPARLATTAIESAARQVAARDSTSLNHYSTIDTNGDDDDDDDDDDCRYEELDPRPPMQTAASQSDRPARTSTFGSSDQQQQQQSMINGKSFLRASMISSSANSSSAYSQGADSNATTGSLVSEAFSRFGSKRNSRQSSKLHPDAAKPMQSNKQQNYPDQLSPYAVSSICSHLPTSSHNHQSPPVSSEAMEALNEQFDINKLMLLDAEENPLRQQQQQQMLPFNVPPPPPPPPPPADK